VNEILSKVLLGTELLLFGVPLLYVGSLYLAIIVVATSLMTLCHGLYIGLRFVLQGRRWLARLSAVGQWQRCISEQG
jgi:hypothetical protein